MKVTREADTQKCQQWFRLWKTGFELALRAGLKFSAYARRDSPRPGDGESVTKLVPSAKADSIFSTLDYPALTRWANGCRRYATGVRFVAPHFFKIEYP